MTQLQPDLRNYPSRKSKIKRRSLLAIRDNNTFITIVLLVYILIIDIFVSPWLALLTLVLVAIGTSHNSKAINKFPITAFSVFPFFISPAAISLLFLAIIEFFWPNIPTLWISVYILCSTPLIIQVWLLIVFHAHLDKDLFLKKVKVALELNNFIFLTLTLLLAIYSYVQKDFKFMYNITNAQQLADQGFQIRDLYNFISVFTTFPFLVSMALTKWHIKWLSYKNELPKIEVL